MFGKEDFLIGFNYKSSLRNFCILVLFFLTACSSTAQSNDNNNEINTISFKEIREDADNPEKYQEKLDNYLDKWFYGQGLGQSITNIGTAVFFPPYALYLLGNAGLSIAGYQPLYVSSILPEKSKDTIMAPYNSVTSIPGRITSSIAGKEYNGK